MTSAIATEQRQEFESFHFDQGTIKDFERSDEGFLIVRGIATKTGVFPYGNSDGTIRWELRHPDDVLKADSLRTLGGKPFTLDHPPDMLAPANVGRYQAGSVGNRVQVLDDGLVEVIINVHREDAIAAIENGSHRELSPGYRCKVVREDGIYQGQPYTHRQVGISYNHLSGVEKARAGPKARLRYDSANGEEIEIAVQMDAADPACKRNFNFVHTESEILQPSKRMATIRVDGAEYEVPELVASVVAPKLLKLDSLTSQLETTEDQLSDAQEKIDSLEQSIQELTVERDRHEGRADSLEVEVEDLKFELEENKEFQSERADSAEEDGVIRIDAAELENRIQKEAAARVDALDDAKSLLAEHQASEVKLDASMSAAEIQKAVVGALYPNQEIADANVAGFYQAIKAGAVRQDSAARHYADVLQQAVKTTQASGSEQKRRDSAKDERSQKRAQNWKRPLAMSKGQ